MLSRYENEVRTAWHRAAVAAPPLRERFWHAVHGTMHEGAALEWLNVKAGQPRRDMPMTMQAMRRLDAEDTWQERLTALARAIAGMTVHSAELAREANEVRRHLRMRDIFASGPERETVRQGVNDAGVGAWRESQEEKWERLHWTA